MANAPNQDVSYYAPSTELADLGAQRYDNETAAVGDRDTALHAWRSGSNNGTTLRPAQIRTVPGATRETFGWSTLKFDSAERNIQEEMKGDLHGGQLHRQNRAARGEIVADPSHGQGFRGGRGHKGGAGMRMVSGGAGGRDAGQAKGQSAGVWVVGVKPDYECPPLAKGFAEELDADLFWNEPIV